MIPYFILLLIPSLFALFNTRKLSLLLWYFTFLFYVLFVGLRLEVGPDWIQYTYIHSTIAYYDFWDVISQAEPLSYLLFWVSQTLGYEVYLSNIFAATVLMTGVFCFARRTTNPWLAVIAATPYFIIVMGMSGVRQTMAAGIILFLFSRWDRYSFISRGMFILTAAMFHTSALINNIFLIIKLNIALRYKMMLGVVVMGLTLFLSFRVSMYSDNVIKYQQRYLEQSFTEQSFGSLYHIAMIAIPAAFGFIYRKRLRDRIHSLSLLHFGLYSSLGILFLNIISTTAASRLTVYLYFVPMMVYPALVSIPGQQARLSGMCAAIAFHALILFSWFSFGNHAFAYLNYKNILFDERTLTPIK